MRQIALLIAIAFSTAGLAQSVPANPQPDAPAPAPTSTSPMWKRVEHLPRGEKIKIRFAADGWQRCEFAGATDAFLYCAPENTDPAQAWPIDRGRIADFKLDHDERNGRLLFGGFVAGAGIAVGVATLNNTHSEEEAVIAGSLGTLLGMIPGFAASCLAGHCVRPPPLTGPYPMAYGINYNLRLRSLPLRRR